MYLSTIIPNPFYHNKHSTSLATSRENATQALQTEILIHTQKPREKQRGGFRYKFHDDTVPKRTCYQYDHKYTQTDRLINGRERMKTKC